MDKFMKEVFKMENLMGKESTRMKLWYMRDNLKMELLLVKVSLNINQERSLKEHLRIMTWSKASWSLQMEMNMMANWKRNNGLEKGYIHIERVITMSVISKWAKKMDMERWYLVMETSMKEAGKLV